MFTLILFYGAMQTFTLKLVLFYGTKHFSQTQMCNKIILFLSPKFAVCSLFIRLILILMASGHLSTQAVMDRHTVLSLMQLLSSSAGMSVSFLNKSM